MTQPVRSDDRPVRGSNLGIVNECDRLRALAEHLDSTGHALRGVHVGSWSSPVRDDFDAAQDAVSKLCHQAADALADYQSTLEVLQLRAGSELAVAAESGDPAREAGRGASSNAGGSSSTKPGGRRPRDHPATEDLAALPRVLPAPAQPRTALPEEPEPAPQRAPRLPAPEVGYLHPVAATRDLVRHDHELSLLNNAVLSAWSPPGRRFALHF